MTLTTRLELVFWKTIIPMLSGLQRLRTAIGTHPVAGYPDDKAIGRIWVPAILALAGLLFGLALSTLRLFIG